MAKISVYPLDANPKLSDKLIGTSVGLNQIGNLENPTYNFSLQQLLDLFSPLLPGNTLQGVLDNNNAATQDINLNGAIYTVDIEVGNVANIFSAHITDSLYIEAGLFDRSNSQGTNGQILKSTGSGVEWFTPSNTISTLQQVLTSGNEADVDMILTANLTAEVINANGIVVQDSFELNGTLIDSNGLTGTSGQMLISLGTGVEWQNVPVYTASSPLFINPATKNITIQQANGTQNGYLSYADWITFNGKQNSLSGTGIVVSNGGTITYVANNSSNWNQAYNDAVLSAAVTGTTTKTLTLTQRDGDTITASWTEGGGGGGISSIGLTMPAAFNVTNSPLTSNGTIAVTAAGSSSQYIKGDGTLGTLPSTAIFIPYTGATANVDLGVYNITANSIIKNGGTSSQFLKADGSVDSTAYFPNPTGTTSQYVRGDGSLATFPTIPTITPSALTKVDDTNITLTLGGTPNSALLQAVSLTLGWTGTLADSRIASASVWNAKQNAITLTTLGTSGPATFVSNVLNIPDYSSVIGGYVPYTGATTNLNLGTHTLLAADLVINHTSGSGVAASITKNGSGEALTVVKGSGSGNAASITGGVTLISELHLTTDLADAYIASASVWNAKFTLPTLTSGSVLFSNGTTIAQDNANFFWDDTNNRLSIGGSTGTSKLNVKGPGYQLYLESTDSLTGISSSAGEMIAYNGNDWSAFNGFINYEPTTDTFLFNGVIFSNINSGLVIGTPVTPNQLPYTDNNQETLIGVRDSYFSTTETGLYLRRGIYCESGINETLLSIVAPNSSIDLVAKIGYGDRFFIAKISVIISWAASTYTYKITSTNTTSLDDSSSVNINFNFELVGSEFFVKLQNLSGEYIYANINANIL